MLISPQERPTGFWAPLGKTSSIPEQMGVDFLTFSPVFGSVGVQRKTVDDLIASLSDGRVAREVLDMKELGWGMWLVEGRPNWSTDGQLLSSRRETFDIKSFRGVLLSLMSQGFFVIQTDSPQDSLSWLSHLDAWMQKDSHKGLNNRPGPKTVWGSTNLKDRQIHLWQSFQGVGYERARDIVAHCGGSGLQLKDGLDLTAVPGVGKKTAEQVERVLNGSGS